MKFSLMELSVDVEVMQLLAEKMVDALAEMQAAIDEAIAEIRVDG